MLKAELGHTLTDGVATADDANLRVLLSNKQKWWAAMYDFPDLETRQDVAVLASTRYYQMPTSLDRTRPFKVETKYNDVWQPVCYGIGSDEFTVWDSDANDTQDPVLKWVLHGVEVSGPPTALTVNTTAAGNVDVGAHSYYVTYVTANGETAFSDALTVTIASSAKKVTLNVPVSTSTHVTARKIYRTKAAGTTVYLVTTISDNTTATYEDNTADSGLVTTGTGGTGAAVTTFEVWPIPASNQTLRFTGTAVLPRLEQDGDVAVLDDMMLVLSVAADRLAKYDASEAGLKLKQAQTIAASLGATLPRREPVFKLAGGNRRNYGYTKVRVN